MAITGEDTGVNILTETGITGSCQRRPQQACHLNTDGSALTYDASHAVTDDVVVARERIKIAVANAGAGKRQGTFRIWTGQ